MVACLSPAAPASVGLPSYVCHVMLLQGPWRAAAPPSDGKEEQGGIDHIDDGGKSAHLHERKRPCREPWQKISARQDSELTDEDHVSGVVSVDQDLSCCQHTRLQRRCRHGSYQLSAIASSARQLSGSYRPAGNLVSWWPPPRERAVGQLR